MEEARLDARNDPTQLVDLPEEVEGLGLEPVRKGFHVIGASQRIDGVGHAALVGEDLLSTKRDPDGLLRRERQGLVHGVRVQGLGSTQHGGHGLVGNAHDVVLGLLRHEAHPGSLCVGTEPPRVRIGGAVFVAHGPSPDPSRRPELRDLLEEVVVDVEEEREPWSEAVHVQAPLYSPLHVLEAVPQRERQLLGGRGTGLPNVVAGDGDRVVLGRVLRAPLEHVDDAAQRRLRREDPGVLRLVLLEDVVLDGSSELIRRDALPLGRRHVEAVEDDGRPVDGHGDRDLVEGNALEERLHVAEG